MKYYRKYIKYKTKYKNTKQFLPEHFMPAYVKFKNSLISEHKRKPFSKNSIQTGGKYIRWNDKGESHTFKIGIDDNQYSTDISVISKSEQDCVIASIDKYKPGIAIIQDITYFEDCAVEGLKKPGGGDKLVRFILDYLIKYKNKYKINRVVLTDTARLACECSDTINLSQLRMVTHGTPWYMKYGFRPYIIRLNKPDIYLDAVIKDNNRIIKKIKMKNFNIKNMIDTVNEKEGLHIDSRTIERTAKKYRYLRDFVNYLLLDFDKNCCIVYYILDALYKPEPPAVPILRDLHRVAYFLDI